MPKPPPYLLFKFLLVCAAICWAAESWAYLPLLIHDSVIAKKAELIVVGRLKTGSVEYIAEDDQLPDGRKMKGFISRVTLVVTEVAAGELKEKEIKLWFRGAAVPLVGGKFPGVAGVEGLGGRSFALFRQVPPESIQIMELNNSPYSRPFKDLRDDHIWFLNAHTDLPGLAKQSQWCVDSWQGVEEAALKDYYLAYRAPDAKKALLAQVTKHPDEADTIRRYVDYLEAVEASNIRDPHERARQLTPLLFRDFLTGLDGEHNYSPYSAANEARAALIDAGDSAGRVLLEALPKTAEAEPRRRVILILGEMKYRPAVDPLVRLLKENKSQWREQRPKAFDPDDKSAANLRLRNSFYEIRGIVEALGKIADPSSRPAIQETLSRWSDLDYGFITQQCDAAIDAIDHPKAPSADGT